MVEGKIRGKAGGQILQRLGGQGHDFAFYSEWDEKPVESFEQRSLCNLTYILRESLWPLCGENVGREGG